MSYGDFSIRYEHTFLRNIYSKEQLASSSQIKSLKDYYQTFKKFLKICLSLQSVLISDVNFDNCDDESDRELKDFLQTNWAGYDLDELRNKIDKMDIKNIIKSTDSSKIPKFHLKSYAFVYKKLVVFPESDIAYETVTTDKIFRNVYRMIKVKMHLHHSHMTGEILGYVHDFCNWRVRENKTEFVVFALNFFGFDMFFLLKGFQATAWDTKDINLGGINLTNINFANLGSETKYIDTLKYYQKSLWQLAATLSVDEKLTVNKVTEQFLRQHDYFSEVWKFLSPQQKEKILDIVADGKGIIPYEKIVDVNSLSLTPENGIFFEKSEFYSNLKQKSVEDED